VQDVGKLGSIADGEVFYFHASLVWPRSCRPRFDKLRWLLLNLGELVDPLQRNLDHDLPVEIVRSPAI